MFRTNPTSLAVSGCCAAGIASCDVRVHLTPSGTNEVKRAKIITVSKSLLNMTLKFALVRTTEDTGAREE